MNRQSFLLRAARGTLSLSVRLFKGVFSLIGSVATFIITAIAYGAGYEDDHQVEEQIVVQPDGSEQFESFVVPKR